MVVRNFQNLIFSQEPISYKHNDVSGIHLILSLWSLNFFWLIIGKPAHTDAMILDTKLHGMLCNRHIYWFWGVERKLSWILHGHLHKYYCSFPYITLSNLLSLVLVLNFLCSAFSCLFLAFSFLRRRWRRRSRRSKLYLRSWHRICLTWVFTLVFTSCTSHMLTSAFFLVLTKLNSGIVTIKTTRRRWWGPGCMAGEKKTEWWCGEERAFMLPLSAQC